MDLWKISTDGGCRDNPGQGAWAWVLESGGRVTDKGCGFLDHTTNNVAEYTAVLMACQFLVRSLSDGPMPEEIQFWSDSQLLVHQMNRVWQVNHPELVAFHEGINSCLQDFSRSTHVSFNWFPREQNKAADALCNRVMDEHGCKRL